jgi:hypothetical protein
MIAALRVSLASILIPIGLLAAFFICYAAFYPAFWAASVTPAGKAFQVGTLLLALVTSSLIWRKERLERHLWAAGLLLPAGLIVIITVFATAFRALGGF